MAGRVARGSVDPPAPGANDPGMTSDDEAARCEWARSGIERDYHDAEWGVPERDDDRLFEMLTLEGAQSGLSWKTVLGKRDNYRRVFHAFDSGRVARMGEREIEKILGEPDTRLAVVRHRGKVESVVTNARSILAMREAGIGLGAHLWSFVGGEPITNRFRSLREIPAQTDVSGAMSKDLKRRGFRFVGPTTCYALMQASGMVNDHVVGCFRHDRVGTAR